MGINCRKKPELSKKLECFHHYNLENLVSIIYNLVLKSKPLGLREFLTTENPLKVMVNAFYFILKVLFVLILPNKSRNKANQTMKVGQLIKYNTKRFS